MWRLRLLLLPFGAIAELILLIACYVIAQFNVGRSTQLMEWSTAHLPDLHWYIGE